MSRTARFAHRQLRPATRREAGALRAVIGSFAAGRAVPVAGHRIGLLDLAAARRAVRSARGRSRRPTTAPPRPATIPGSTPARGSVRAGWCRRGYTHRKQRPGSVEKALPYNRIDQKGSAGPVTSDRRAPHQASPAAGLPSEGMVRLRGTKGTWRVMGTGKDGSVTLFRGRRRQWRSVAPDRLSPIRPRRRRSTKPRPRPKPDPPRARP